MNSQYRSGGFMGIPPVIKNLIIINALFYLATMAFGSSLGIDLIDRLGLHFPLAEEFRVWQPITHMFMHGGTMHLLFNMFALWMFGTQIERDWGPQRFLAYFFITGLGAAFTHELVVYFEIRPTLEVLNNFLGNPNGETLSLLYSHLGGEVRLSGQPDPEFLKEQIDYFYNYQRNFLNAHVAIGASGAVYGVLLAFGMMYPNQVIMFIFPPIPIKAKYFVIILGVLALVSSKTDNSSNVAHAAHLGGMIFGYLVIRFWNRSVNRPHNF